MAQFHDPVAVCVSVDSRWLMVADLFNGSIRCVDLRDGSVSTFAGSGESDIKHGSCSDASFYYPASVCVDPIHPGCFFVGDRCTIRYCDGPNSSVSLVAGSTSQGYRDGAAETAGFCEISGLICTDSGQALYASDLHNHRIRSVNLNARQVKTVCGDGRCRYDKWKGDGGAVRSEPAISEPFQLCLDRSSPEPALWIATRTGLRRFDTETGTYRYRYRPCDGADFISCCIPVCMCVYVCR